MRIDSAGRSDTGRKRKKNEDSFSIDERICLFIVADGMGGHAAGEVASEIAVLTIRESIHTAAWKKGDHPATTGQDLGTAENLMAAIQTANDRILLSMEKNLRHQGMGTTVVSTWVVGNRAYIGHVGDSRAYLIRDRKIRQLTHDHTLVNEQVRRGILTHVEARHHPSRNILTRAVGSQPEVTVDITEEELCPEDKLLLCSDGLYTMVTEQAILEIIARKSKSLGATCDALVQEANQRGGEDNITVILLHAHRDNSQR